MQFYRKVSILYYMMLHNSTINLAIAVILVRRESLYNVQELRLDRIIPLPDALGNLAGAPNLQSSNSRKNFRIPSMNLKLCTLINHYHVKTISNFQNNWMDINRDIALQSCSKIAQLVKLSKIFLFSRFCLTLNFYSRYNF